MNTILNKQNRIMILILSLVMVLSFQFPALGVEDAEESKHGNEAARYQIVDTHKFDGYELVQIDLPVLSHYSYMLISDGIAIVVDPGRDTDIYEKIAKEKNAVIKDILLTHSHADFVAGHMEMFNKFKAVVHINKLTDAGYEHDAIDEKTWKLEHGKVSIKAIATPGHTPDGMVFLVSSVNSPEKIDLALTGDTLFIGSVGRPDLIGGDWTAMKLASLLFDTLWNKIAKLDDSVKVFPAHGAGSLCGANLRDDPYSTIGEEKNSNPYLQIKNKNEFITKVISSLSEPPQYFGHNAKMNHDGPAIVDWTGHRDVINATEELMDTDKFYVVDLRDSREYAEGHIPNSVNIALRGRFETWTGIMVPWGSNLVLTGNDYELKEGIKRLHRIGYTAKTIEFKKWLEAKLPLKTNNMTKPEELHSRMEKGTAPLIVDVRLPAEWMGLRIGNVFNIPLNKLSERSNKLEKNKEITAVCNSAYRSSMAVGILEREGFDNVSSLEGGGKAWKNAGFPVFGSHAGEETAVRSEKRHIKLAERISAAELKRMIMDLPDTFEIVDIRPSVQFDDYNLPQSMNVDIADILRDKAFLVGAGPLVIVDRDGSLAMMVGGILSQKTERTIKVLYGGLEKYWENSSFDNIKSLKQGNSSKSNKKYKKRYKKTPVKKDKKEKKRKKVSAGC